MTLKELNYAGDHMVVGSLEVLGSLNGGNVKEIRRNIDQIQKQADFAIKQQEQYWNELSSDGVITPLEKQQLLKEMRSITQSQAAIVLQARSVGMEGSEFIQDYLGVYNDLYSYLYATLKLFDDMEMSTEISDRDTFNSLFYSYYYDESFVYIALSKGLLNSLNLTVLTSLSDPGTEGDLGLYKGNLYQYTDGEWKHVATGDYKGALTSLPVEQEESFFLAADNFILTEALYVNDEPLYVNSYELGVKRLFRKGYIYYCEDGLWYEESDKTNYRYVAAFADVLNITGELPQVFQDALDELQEQIDQLDFPSYKGLSNTDPLNPQEGDYYVYSGTTTINRRKSDIYRYTNGEWERLDPLESQNSSYYMQALEDILSLNNADPGYFASLFAQSLFANNAFLYALSTKILTLREGGYIQSENYDPSNPRTTGFRLDHDGNIDANGDTYIGGTCTIEGAATFRGTIEGSFIHCGSLQVTNQQMTLRILSYASNTSVLTLWRALQDLGFDSTPRTVESVLSSYSSVLMKYGDLVVNTVQITRRYDFPDTWWEIDFNNHEKWLTFFDDIIDPQTIKQETYIDVTKEVSLALKLTDLPEIKPVESNIVYRDGNNLKIS